jgi:methanogenic corrinoid protein MtbC1
MSGELVNAIVDMREEEALKLVKEMVEDGTDPMAILDLAREAMDIVGQRYEKGIYFLPELIVAGEMLTQITNRRWPRCRRASASARCSSAPSRGTSTTSARTS